MRITLALGAAVLSIGLASCASGLREMAGHDDTRTGTMGGTVAPARADTAGLSPALDTGAVSGAVKAADTTTVKRRDTAGVTAADSAAKTRDLAADTADRADTSHAARTDEDRYMGWSTRSREAAAALEQRFGPPSERSDTMLTWSGEAPFRRTVVHRVEENDTSVAGGFIEIVLDYPVPDSLAHRLDELNAGLTVGAENAELSVRCDRREFCILALNAAHDVIRGGRSVEQARADYLRAIELVQQGENVPEAQELRFTTGRP